MRRSVTRRAFLATVSATLLLAACGGAPSAPTAAPKAAEPAKPAEASKPAESKPAAAPASPQQPLPTPTLPPVFTPVAQGSGTTKLLMRVHWSGSQLNEFMKVVNDYNTTQGPKDKTYLALERFVAGQAGPIATFIADFQAGTQEDVYHLSDAYLADLASRNFFQAPPQEIQAYIRENYLPSAVATGTWQGNIMGHPTENQPHMMFANKKMFAEAGLDVNKDMPKKWDDIRRVAKALTKKDASGQKTQAGFIVHPTNGERIMVQRLMFQFLNGAPLVDTSGPVPKFDVTSDGARQFTELLAGMQQDGSLSAELGQEPAVWPQRKGAIVTHDAFAVFFRLVSSGQPGILEEQHTAPLYNAAGNVTGNMSRNYHFAVSSKTKQRDLSWQFLRWMNDGPEWRMQAFQTHVFGFVASVKNYDLPKFFPEQMKTAFTESMKEPKQTGMPVIKGLNEAFNIFRDAHDALVIGKMTSAEATKQMDEELKKAMANAYSG
jgi:ABC-type glycerol-3-phosphate transport system substrate-binding protein